MDRRDILRALPLGVLAAAVPIATRAKATRVRHRVRTRLDRVTTYCSVPGAVVRLHARTGAMGTTILSLTVRVRQVLPAAASLGISFGDLPGFRQGVAFWRYAPWKSWTKPMAMRSPADLEADDVQCAYWQYDDGSYGVALPLGGGGFRATLGVREGRFATVSRALAPASPRLPLPQVAIGFGPDLHVVMGQVFADAMDALGTPENLRARKVLPEALTYLGWNTWNASDMGRNLTADWTLAQVDAMLQAGAPIGTLVLDDGWFQASDSRLQSLSPHPEKFPGGFKPVVDALLARGLKHVGVWHAFNGYWNGIDPDSELGRAHKGELFTWTQPPSPVDTSGKTVTYTFLKPEPAILNAFFDGWHSQLRAAGLTLIKVDNQLVSERMARDNVPVWDMARAVHGALNAGATRHFGNAIINCMDMTNDAFLNFGGTAVARSVEDYFPYKPAETYNLQEGNAAAHVLQAMYNALWFGQMVFPDFDMFESTNPNASLHASVRAANCAPIYITDKAGSHDIALLKSLVAGDGVTLRADTPLTPVADCLFQIQQAKLFKASSMCGEGALLLLANLSDSDAVSGEARLSDITGLPAGDYAAYGYNGQKVWHAPFTQGLPVTYERFGHDLIRIAPVRNGRAVLGLKEKRNGLASVMDIRREGSRLSLTVRDEGTLLVWSRNPPAIVTVDGKAAHFTHDGELLAVMLDAGPRRYFVEIA